MASNRASLAAELMFVGEQPGDVEDRKGEPFVGPAGHREEVRKMAPCRGVICLLAKLGSGPSAAPPLSWGQAPMFEHDGLGRLGLGLAHDRRVVRALPADVERRVRLSPIDRRCGQVNILHDALID